MSGAAVARRVWLLAAVIVLLLVSQALLTVAQEPTSAVNAGQRLTATSPSITPPAISSSALTPVDDTALQPLFADSFDDENYTANFWTFGAGWEQTSIIGRGQVLEVSDSESPAILIHAPLADVVTEARFLVRSGAARLTVRESEQGAYTLDLDRRGQARLYESDSVLGSGVVSRFASGQWHTLRLSAIDGTLRAWVDGQLILEAEDSTPLPAGAISFAVRDLGRGSLRVDDFALWIPVQAAPTATPTATPTASAADLPAEPQLQMIFEDNFSDAGITDGMWTLDGWQRGLNGEEWVLGSTGNAAAIFANSQLDDFAAQLRYLTSAGVVQVHLRQSETEAYTVAIRADGRVSLLRGNRSLGTARVANYAPGEWHALWFSVIEGVIRVGIDYEQVIAMRDDRPLPAGGVAIEGSAPAGETLLVDDFALWIPAAEESQLEPRMMAAASAENLYWDFDGQNYAGWYSGLPGETSYWATTSPFYRSSYPGCQHVTIRTTSTGYEGLAGRGSWFGGWTSECPTGWALNGVIDLGQSYLVTNVTYARYTKFEGLGRTYGIVLRNENFQAVPGPVWYTIAGTNYATHSHNLPTPSYVRYVQVLGNTSGSYNVIFDWVQLNYTPPTPTPSPTPTATPTHMPASARCPTITADDATYFAGPDLSTMPVNVLISGTGIDLMGIYINGGWYAIRRYSSPEGGAMAAQGMRAAAIETEAIEGWIQAEDVVLTGEDGLPLPCLVDIPEVDGDGNEVTPTPTFTPSPTPTATLSWGEDGIVQIDPDQPIPPLQESESECERNEFFSSRVPCAMLAYNHYQQDLGGQITWGQFAALVMASEGGNILLGNTSTGTLVLGNPQVSGVGVCWRRYGGAWLTGSEQCNVSNTPLAPGLQGDFAYTVWEWIFNECAKATGYVNYQKDGVAYSGECNERGLSAFLEQVQSIYQDQSFSTDPDLYLPLAEEEFERWGWHGGGRYTYGYCPCTWGNVGREEDARTGSNSGFSYSYLDWDSSQNPGPGYDYFKVY